MTSTEVLITTGASGATGGVTGASGATGGVTGASGATGGVTGAAPAGPAPAAGDVPPPDSGRYSLLVSREAGWNGRVPSGSVLPARRCVSPEVQAAQRLRHDVFAIEQGARLAPGPAADEGRDEDRFDAFCDHLMVRDDTDGSIVGTYRMLTPEGAAEAGGLYSDSEFDLRRLDGLRPHLVEVGRSCVHPAHRTGTVLSLVWAGMWRYLVLSGHRWLIGCASVPLTADGELPGAVWSLVREKHYAPPERRVVPHRPAPIGPDEGRRAARAQTPPLLRGYLRLGAQIAGAPAIDPDFGVADLLVLLDHTAIDPRWRRHLLGDDR